MIERWVPVLCLAWVLSLGACGRTRLFPPDPFHHELIREYAWQTGWADRAFELELTCIRVNRPICYCEPERLGEILGGLAPDQRLDVNRASLEELTILPGIGPAIAGRIIARREERLFEQLEDMLDVSGIGPTRLQRIAHLVRFDSEPSPDGSDLDGGSLGEEGVIELPEEAVGIE